MPLVRRLNAEDLQKKCFCQWCSLSRLDTCSQERVYGFEFTIRDNAHTLELALKDVLVTAILSL